VHLNDSMTQFRLAARELFNTFFRVEAPYTNDGWALEARFRVLESALFDQLVAAPNSLPLDSYGSHQPGVRVALRGLDFAPVMVNREVDSGYWDHPLTEATKDVELSFVRFFDWDILAVRDYQYVRVKIEAWPSHSEVVGKHALIEARCVGFDHP
jgi:hypothetical protein